MVILFPLPGYVAKMIQTVQKEKMNKVWPWFHLLVDMILIATPDGCPSANCHRK
jgi:hypothetical protein